MKKIIVAVLVLACILSQNVFAADLSEDIKADLFNMGIMQGDEGGNLNLDRNITRAEAAKMLCIAVGADTDNCVKRTFSDVTEAHWAYEYICVVVQNGIMTCDGEKKFNPDGEVTNEEIIKIIVNLLGEGMRTMVYGGEAGYPIVAQELGITEEMKFEIDEPAKRGDVAFMVYRMMDVPIMFIMNGYEGGMSAARVDQEVLINLKGAFIKAEDGIKGDYNYKGQEYMRIGYDELKKKGKEKSLDIFNSNREAFEGAKNVFVKMLGENKLIQLADSSREGVYYLSVNGKIDKNFEKVNAEEKAQLDSFMYALDGEKFYGAYATKDAIEITLFRGNFHAGVVYSEKLPKEYESYAEIERLGDNWYYFRTADFKVSNSMQ